MTKQTLFAGPLRWTSVNAPSTGVEIWTPHWQLIDYREAVQNLAISWDLSLADLLALRMQ